MTKMTKFIITGQGRCGSNLLMFALKEHPEVYMTGEYYHPGLHDDLQQIPGNARARAFFDRVEPNYKAAGFKIFAHHAVRKPQKSVWRFLTTKKIRVIHMIRKNTLERLISLNVARVSKSWVKGNGDDLLHDSIKLNHSSEFWLEKIKEDLAIEASLTERFSSNNYLQLTYEGLVENWDVEIARVASFLNVKEINLPVKIEKQEKRSKAERLENYEEMVKCFSNTEFSWMLK